MCLVTTRCTHRRLVKGQAREDTSLVKYPRRPLPTLRRESGTLSTVLGFARPHCVFAPALCQATAPPGADAPAVPCHPLNMHRAFPHRGFPPPLAPVGAATTCSLLLDANSS